MNAQHRLHTYKETQITTTDPCTVLLMLYQGAIDFLGQARASMVARDMAQKGSYILRANDIITQFIASLDHDAGGEIARNLEGLYRYMLDKIMLANVNNDPQLLTEVITLLTTLKSGWEEAILSQRKQAAAGGAR
jgi:flagellar secretion chaperone FliS